jgi:phosphoheptose isomerase
MCKLNYNTIITGRYTHPITPVENRICSNCNSKSVEDEIHFLMYCSKFENLRRELFSNVLNYNAAIFIKVDKDYEIVHERMT